MSYYVLSQINIHLSIPLLPDFTGLGSQSRIESMEGRNAMQCIVITPEVPCRDVVSPNATNRDHRARTLLGDLCINVFRL
jgi:hypothetical protein